MATVPSGAPKPVLFSPQSSLYTPVLEIGPNQVDAADGSKNYPQKKQVCSRCSRPPPRCEVLWCGRVDPPCYTSPPVLQHAPCVTTRPPVSRPGVGRSAARLRDAAFRSRGTGGKRRRWLVARLPFYLCILP